MSSNDEARRRGTEQALLRSERLLQQAEALGHTGSWEHDLITGEIYQSDEQRRLFFGDDPTKGLRFEDYAECVHPDDRARVMSSHASLLATDGPTDIEYRVIWPDGSVHVIFGRARVVRDGDGRAIRTIGTNVDVTAQRAAQEQLARRARQQEALADLGLHALRGGDVQELLDRAARLVVDAFGADLSVIAEVRGTSRSPVRALAGPWADDATERLAACVETRLGEWLATNPTTPLSLAEMRARTQSKFPFLDAHGVTTGVVVPIAGRRHPLGVVAAYWTTDRARSADDFAFLTALATLVGTTLERAAMEAELRQAQKMEAVGQLAGSVAHDFNNLLSVVLGHSTLLLDELPAGDAARNDLEEIVKAAELATTITRQLLTFSRRRVADMRVLDLGEVVRGIEGMLRRIAGPSVGVVVIVTAGGRVRTDAAMMEQVLMNLVVNARDAMQNGGAVTIAVTDAELDVTEAARLDLHPGWYVRLSVVDDGVGMDDATRARIFEPFFTTKAAEKGTGLGLSTVLGIVQESAGKIAVRSEPGKGTTFDIFLPRASESATMRAAQATSASPPTRTLGTETILLVEDEEQVRSAARDILKRAGYHVLEAPNAGEALLLCERHRGEIDLLVTDVVLPHASGPELAARLRVLRPRMKLLFVSGYGAALAEHDLRDGEVLFLRKPFTSTSLTTNVRRALDGGS